MANAIPLVIPVGRRSHAARDISERQASHQAPRLVLVKTHINMMPKIAPKLAPKLKIIVPITITDLLHACGLLAP
ncbi:hypothetical protein KZY98_14890, partial [Croceibacter atlanticus]|uniref:hypothetical protein n=1 Tax=Croceibacter atlanticus TaxID=313588 RepID=UPI001C5DC68D